MTPTDDRYLKLAELIEYSGLSRDTIERAMRDPVDPLPSHQVGVRILIRRSEFDAWMDRRRRGGASAGLSPLVQRQLARLREPVRPRLKRAGGFKNTPPATL